MVADDHPLAKRKGRKKLAGSPTNYKLLVAKMAEHGVGFSIGGRRRETMMIATQLALYAAKLLGGAK